MIRSEIIDAIEEKDYKTPIDSITTLKKRIKNIVPNNLLSLLNDRGFYLLSGQIGDKTIIDHEGEDVILELKEYLMGIVHKDETDRFHVMKQYIVTENDGESVGYDINIELDEIVDSFPVRRMRRLKETEWESIVEFPLDESSWYMMKMLEDLCTAEFYKELTENYVIIGICDRRWGRKGLMKRVIEILS